MAQSAVTEKVETFVKDARARLKLVEKEAGKVRSNAEKAAERAVKDLRTKAKKGQRELKGWWKTTSGRELELEKLAKTTQKTLREWLKSAEAFRAPWVRAAGFAAANDVQLLAQQVSRLSKKVDALARQNKAGPSA